VPGPSASETAAESFAAAKREIQERLARPDPGREAAAAARSILAAAEAAEPEVPTEKAKKEKRAKADKSGKAETGDGAAAAIVPAVATERRSGGSRAVVWILFLAVIGAIVYGGYRFRGEIVTLWPPATKIYAMVGVAVEPPQGYGLRVVQDSIKFRWETTGGASSLVVTGTIENFVDVPQRVPPLRVMLVDKDKKVLHSEMLQIGERMLKPGEKYDFTTEIRNPAAEAAAVLIRFQGAGG
jgi:hypothetical protein